MTKTIEIEYRSLISEEKFLELKSFLASHGEVLGNDNKDTAFYIWPDKVIKVVNNESTGKAKIALKPGRIGKQSFFHESELTVLPGDVTMAHQFCEQLEPEKVMHAYQFRTNYTYKGVEIAVKYTQSWGFHVELEVIVESEDHHAAAEETIRSVAAELDLHILNDEELFVLTNELESGKLYGAYSDQDFPYKD